VALADYTALKAKMDAPSQHYDHLRALTIPNNTPTRCSFVSSWKANGAPLAGATPTAAAVCDRTTAGAVPIVNASAGELRMWIRRCIAGRASGSTPATGSFMFADRLIHQGGLDGTVTTAQTVSTPALTRATSGAGVIAALECYTAVGSTVASATVSYTNQAGVAGQVSQPIDFISTLSNQGGRILPISLAAGDTGVQAVSTVTLSASTLVAGNFGVTLYRPITGWIPIDINYASAGHPLLDTGGYAGLVPTDACIWMLINSNGGPITSYASIDMNFFED
jgi:hypothetical protein